jgi:hypothetical protein
MGAHSARRRSTARVRLALPVVRWLQLGTIAAGVGVALVAAPGTASADEGGAAAASSASSQNAHAKPAVAHAKSIRVTANAVSHKAVTASSAVQSAAVGQTSAPAPGTRAAVSRTVTTRAAAKATASSATSAAAVVTATDPVPAKPVDPLGAVAAFLGVPGAPATSDPSLFALPVYLRLAVGHLLAGTPVQSSDSTEVIVGLFNEMLRDDPTAAELQTYTDIWNLSGIDGVVAGLYSSTNFRQSEVTNYYLELLNRSPTADELNWGTTELMWGLPEPDLAAQIAGTTEFYLHSSSGGGAAGVPASATTFVNLMYRSMVGQVADPTIAPIYIQQLQSGISGETVATQFVSSAAFRDVKIQEAFEVVYGRAATGAEVAQYEDNWDMYDGLAGITTSLLTSSENVARIDAGAVTLPDMEAVAQLQQLLLAAYTDSPDGFVKLLNNLLNADEDHPCTATSTTCNLALYNLLTTGGADLGIGNSSLQTASISANVGKLVPTQNEIDMVKSLTDPLQDPDILETYFQGGTIIPDGGVIVTADDGTYIVDGHHRWSAIYVINPSTQIGAIDIGYVPDPQDALKEAQIGVVSQLGYLATSTTTGANLYTVDQDEFDETVNDLIKDGSKSDKVLKVFTDYLGLDEDDSKDEKLESIDAYLWSNVLRMRQDNPYIPDATSRGVMPQMKPLLPIVQSLQGGTLNYTFPVIAYLG